jgi:hypothetical protein
MTDFTRVLPGAVNNAGDNLALFLKLMGGEVLTAFKNKTMFEDKQQVRSISAGKSAAFPATGRLAARYVVPGVTQVGQAMNHNEVVIGVDGELLADAFVASIDEAYAHWDVRAPITESMGDALAQAYDLNVARNVVIASRSANVVTGEPGGANVQAATIHTDAAVLAAGLYTAAQTLDEKFIDAANRYAAFRPAQYYLAVQRNDLINKDWDGKGSYADGTIQSIAGITLMKSNNVPNANDNANSNIPTAYRRDYSVTRGIVWTPQAVGTVKLLDLKSEAEYMIRQRGWYMVSSYAMGHGTLRPPCAVELRSGTPV